jgi:Cu+-exporting ATPase
MNEPGVPTTVKDPVCGMDVNPDVATALGLQADHDGQTYYFCGRGCKLNFEEHPSTYLDPGHTPSM